MLLVVGLVLALRPAAAAAPRVAGTNVVEAAAPSYTDVELTAPLRARRSAKVTLPAGRATTVPVCLSRAQRRTPGGVSEVRVRVLLR